MAGAMVLYVAISQLGLVVGNRIASGAAASGPAIYNYTWLVLMLPFGMIGVTVLTVVMPRLSRNAAAEDIPAVLDDLSLATRLTMVTLIPIVAFMTVGGPAIGSALFAYGNFGAVDAGYLGRAIAFSAFTLIPYALVLLQLRVFYARQQPWIPIAIIMVITSVKIAGSLVAPHLTARSRAGRGLPRPRQRAWLPGRRGGRLSAAAGRAEAPARACWSASRAAHNPGYRHRIVAGRPCRLHRGPRRRPADADQPVRRRRIAAAVDVAGGDHRADHRGDHVGRGGARRPGRPVRRHPPTTPPARSRNRIGPIGPRPPGHPRHVP